MLARLALLLLLILVVAVPLFYKVEQDRRYRNLRVVEEGILFRSGQLTPEGFARVVRENGIRTVVSLRETKGENEQYQDQFEVDFCNENRVKYERFSYLDWGLPDGTKPATANIRRFLDIMANPNFPKPVLVHCFAGIHRTGGHVAAYRIERNGWKNEDAMQEMLSMGTRRTTFAPNLVEFVRSFQPREAVGKPVPNE